MKLSDFFYELPESLIAQNPLEKRDNSRLLVLEKDSWNIKEIKFFNILDELWENDVLVINKTRTINARLFWELDIFPKWKKQIKKVEIFLHKQISNDSWECLWYPWKNLKIWREIRFFDVNWDVVMTWLIEKISEMWRIIKFSKSNYDFLRTIENIWEIPLPPYIKEKLENKERYQTVFSQIEWSAASPTAWLHFTNELLENIEKKWVKIEKILLHVWVWTFKPVEAENIEEHQMHKEFIEIEKEVSDRLIKYKNDWKRIIAVWTTSVRTLESFTDKNWVLWYWAKETWIFIYPWYDWKFVDSVITNFHLPCSTLLLLVSSFWWSENIKNAYKYAVENEFRFFSFWDAMWIR